MNPREKKLLIVVVSFGVLIGVWKGSGKYRAWLDALDDKIDRKLEDKEEAELACTRARNGMDVWKKVGAQTLSMEPTEGINILRDELYAISERIGLKNVAVNPGRTASWKKNGVRRLPCSFSAVGRINEIVNFLYELETQPYLVRCTSLSLSSSRKKEEKGLMSLSLRLDALVLPENKKVAKVVTAVLDPKQRKAVPERLQLASAAAYSGKINVALFEPYKPPLPGKVVLQAPSNNAKDQDKAGVMLRWKVASGAKKYRIFLGPNVPSKRLAEIPSTTYRVPAKELKEGVTYGWRVDAVNESGVTTGDMWRFKTKGVPVEGPDKLVELDKSKPPPPDGHLVIGRILSSPFGQQIVLEDPRNKSADDQRKEVGEEVYGGTLVFVDLKGAVTEDEQGRWFHPKGEALQSRQPLMEMDQPEIFHAIRKLEERAVGISRGPG